MSIFSLCTEPDTEMTWPGHMPSPQCLLCAATVKPCAPLPCIIPVSRKAAEGSHLLKPGEKHRTHFPQSQSTTWMLLSAC